MSEAVDYSLLHFFRKKMNQKAWEERVLFRSQLQCQNLAARQLGMKDAVFLLRNHASEKHQAVFYGTNTCKNTFICPVCAERIMAKHRAKIQSAIDAMKDRGYEAAMITFTIPHNHWYSCEDAFTILQNSMRKLQKHWGQQKGRFCNNAWTRQQRDLDLKHYVRCTEFIYGKNGWHPHYHALYWTKKENLQKFKDYEADVLKLWYKIVKQETLNQFKKTKTKYTEKELEGRIDEIFDRMNTESQSYFVSKNSDGEVTAAVSSDYITGWGADKELTGLKQKSGKREGYYTAYDLLEIAAGHKTAKITAEKAWDLFLEYATVTKRLKAKRVKISNNRGENLKSIITTWQNVNGSKELLKKKQQQWENVCWFTKQQWSRLCWLEQFIPVLSNIMYLAYDDQLLKSYLESLEVYAYDNEEHAHAEHVRNIMNGKAKDIVQPTNTTFVAA